MALIEDLIDRRNSIQAYESDHININGRLYSGSLILSATQIISPWAVTSVTDLNESLIQEIFNLKPDVILLGTGEKQIFPDVEILGLFAQQGLGVEVMNTGAMCRTFNILCAEDRMVVAGVIQ